MYVHDCAFYPDYKVYLKILIEMFLMSDLPIWYVTPTYSKDLKKNTGKE